MRTLKLMNTSTAECAFMLKGTGAALRESIRRAPVLHSSASPFCARWCSQKQNHGVSPSRLLCDDAGNQSVVIHGNNFGSSLGASDRVFYTLRVVNAVNTSLPVQPISASTNGTVLLYPTGCFISVPHSEIRKFPKQLPLHFARFCHFAKS